MAAEAVISFAVEKLGNLLIQKVTFLQGIEEEVQWLRDELERMKSFLRDAAERQANDQRIRKWISDIREVALDAEDAIETFVLKVESRRRSRGLLGKCACLPIHVCHLDSVGKEIKSIRKRLQDIERSRQTYGIQNLGEGMDSSRWRSSENVERRRRLSPWQEDKHLVGLNEDVEKLLKEAILEEKKKGLSIAAIVGMGGIGKSTLARKIYNHTALAGRFECRAWVVVSSKFTDEDIIKQIMLQLQISPDPDRLKLLESMNHELRRLEMLQQMLHEHLVGRRYFIVLDDVWEPTHWESLRKAFPDQQVKTSRLLLTSRNQIITVQEGYIHKMRLLDPDESRELLLKTSFFGKTDHGECPKELEKIGREILKKCDGLPLAITVAGGLLVNEGESKSGWEKVLKQIRNYHLETNEISSNVSAILELSYQNLPPRLKACFLCLGFFKEDAIILPRRLAHIWVAQGFFSSEKNSEETMEETATSYLNELINRNLIQVKDMHADGRVKACHVHDFLRELAIRKAEEEIGLEILREEGNSSKSSCKPRHRVVFCSKERLMTYSLDQNKHIRSLFLHDLYPGIFQSYWKSFELLRILDIDDGNGFLSKLPNAFDALIGLRYLRLRCGGELMLPRWLDRLKNLEILDIIDNGLGLIVKLPDPPLKMDSLRHLYGDLIFGVMRPIFSWKSLETLKYIDVIDLMLDIDSILMASCRLRKLGIYLSAGWCDLSRLNTLLEKMENLVQLHLTWDPLHPIAFTGSLVPDYLTKLKLSGAMIQRPAASMFPQNLSHLTLKETQLKDDNDPMAVLGTLPNLLYLKLCNDAYLGTRMEVLHDGFPRLKGLSLLGMNDLRFIHIEEGGIPELQRMEINLCPNLETESLREHLRSAAIIIIS